ncbi:MAG: DedA family protein [Sneathiellaceae bacterium]
MEVWGIDLAQLISDYGSLFYVVTFIWVFLEGETFVIFSGALAEQGYLNLWLLIAVAWIGSFCGDQLYFFIGRRYGPRLIARFPRIERGADRALGLLHRYHTGFILSYRFIYGVRNFASFAMGMSEVPWRRFLVLNFVAAGVWAIAFAGSGYVIGRLIGALLGDYAKSFMLVFLALFLLLFSLGLWFMHRKMKREEGQAKKPRTPLLTPPKELPAKSGSRS